MHLIRLGGSALNQTPLDWDGNRVGYEDATGGGACGETVPAPKAPH